MLALIIAAALIAPPDDVWEITIWEDNPAVGAKLCRQAEIEYAPAVCRVEPEWMAPDPYEDGWAS